MKILIIKLSSLGDIVHALPVLTTLKNYYPGYEVDWLVDERFEGLLNDHPQISRLHIWTKDWRANYETLCILEHSKYNCILDLQGLMKTALITWFANPPQSVTLSPSRERLAELVYKIQIPTTPVLEPSRHIIQRNLDILKAFNIDPASLKIDQRKALFKLPAYPLPERYADALQGKPYLIFAPETSWQSKTWQQWQSLIKLTQAGLPEFEIVLLGQDSSMPYTVNLDWRGQTDLSDLKALLAHSSLVVASDSGILHIGAAYRPVLGLFGATSPERTGAWQSTNLTLRIDCSPCHKRKCPLSNPAQKDRCMRELAPEMVFTQIQQSLQTN
ncbi:MAG: glycosyltransferase family 9 protein [Candidatus Caenarcaniphilales bacterium]|nr:glycosyltransferase family 9 protein [Candidatus Caenarcaniphilales bacterium]